MAKYNCLNPIADCGISLFTDSYESTDNFAEANAVLVKNVQGILGNNAQGSSATFETKSDESTVINEIPVDNISEYIKSLLIFPVS